MIDIFISFSFPFLSRCHLCSVLFFQPFTAAILPSKLCANVNVTNGVVCVEKDEERDGVEEEEDGRRWACNLDCIWCIKGRESIQFCVVKGRGGRRGEGRVGCLLSSMFSFPLFPFNKEGPQLTKRQRTSDSQGGTEEGQNRGSLTGNLFSLPNKKIENQRKKKNTTLFFIFLSSLSPFLIMLGISDILVLCVEIWFLFSLWSRYIYIFFFVLFLQCYMAYYFFDLIQPYVKLTKPEQQLYHRQLAVLNRLFHTTSSSPSSSSSSSSPSVSSSSSSVTTPSITGVKTTGTTTPTPSTPVRKRSSSTSSSSVRGSHISTTNKNQSINIQNDKKGNQQQEMFFDPLGK